MKISAYTLDKEIFIRVIDEEVKTPAFVATCLLSTEDAAKLRDELDKAIEETDLPEYEYVWNPRSQKREKRKRE